MIKLFIAILLFTASFAKAQNPQQMFWMMTKPDLCQDADYLKFVKKVVNDGGSLTTTEKSAICTLVKQLKDSSLWGYLNVIYPMVGASAASCAVNLKDTGNYNLTFGGGEIIYSSIGIRFHLIGTSSYADTHFNPNGILGQNDISLSFYSQDSVVVSSVEMGASSTGTIYKTYLSASRAYAINSPFGNTYVNSDARGFWMASRTESTTVNNYRNGINNSSSSTTSVSSPNLSIYLGSINDGGTANSGSDKACSFASVGKGLTSAQALTFYRIVQKFQTTLGRNK